MAIFQSMLLIVSILAFAFIVGGGIKVVSAAGASSIDCQTANPGAWCEDNSICFQKECSSKCVAEKSGTCGLAAACTSGTVESGFCPGEITNVCCVPAKQEVSSDSGIMDSQSNLGLNTDEVIIPEKEAGKAKIPTDKTENPITVQKVVEVVPQIPYYVNQVKSFREWADKLMGRTDRDVPDLSDLSVEKLGITAKEEELTKAKDAVINEISLLKKSEEPSAIKSLALRNEELKAIDSQLATLDKSNSEIEDVIKETRKEPKEILEEAEKLKDKLGETPGNEKEISELDKIINDIEADIEKNYISDFEADPEDINLFGTSNFFQKTGYGFFHKVPMKSAGNQAAIDIANKAGVKVYERVYEKTLAEGIKNKLTKEAAEKAAKEAASEASKKTIGKALGSQQTFMGYALRAAAAASLGAMLTVQVFKLAGAGERNMVQIKRGAVGAAAATTIAVSLFAAGTSTALTGGIAAVATGIWAAVTYQDYAQEIFTYKAGLWEPPTGGETCTDCNELRYGCSEYQCHSYGSACELLNPGTQYEACDWNNSNDFDPPVMRQLDILDVNYEYNPMEEIKLPERGVSVVYTGPGADEKQCIPPFTGIKFGVKTDEPAQCKIDLTRKINYDEMVSLMSEGPVYTYNHTIEMPSSAFPSEYALNEAGWSIDSGMDQSYYIRCQDKNGNLAPAHFAVNFCVDKGPDTTAPTIETNYINGAYISHDTIEVDDIEVYTNEPADCRWDFKDTDYDSMENDMSGCSKSLGQYTFPRIYSYGCKTTLTGIKAGETNNYFIRCKDKPDLDVETSRERRVANEESYLLSLTGTNELAISELTVNGNELFNDGVVPDEALKFVDSTSPIEVELVAITTQGAEKEGQARCSYNIAGGQLYYDFYNGGVFDYTNLNKHILNLDQGNYDYNIRCCDIANNCDTVPISFEVETDLDEPVISRAYAEGSYMKFVTTEEAECVYSLSTCNYLFADGSTIETRDNLEHFTSWDTESDLYVKCRDGFGNVPSPDECSIVARANKAPELSAAENVL